MGNFGKKLKGMFGVDDIEHDYDETTEDGYTGVPMTSTAAGRAIGINSAALELKVVKPDTFVNSRQVADHLLNNRTVVLNLESTNKEAARRILDFLSGVAYSIGGQLKKVANNTYIITPSNVDVSGDQVRSTPAAQPSEAEQPQTAQFSGDTLF